MLAFARYRSSRNLLSTTVNRCRLASRVACASASTHAKSKQSEKLLLLDVDCGVDDASAIVLALSKYHPSKLLAITCVNGNTGVDQIVKNVGYVLEGCNRDDIPVYAGASLPLLGECVRAPVYHGFDGLGDMKERIDNPQWINKVLRKEHAVNAMINLVNQYQKQISLVAVGPLTNLALAQRMDPTFPSKLKDLTIMGGNYQGKGNITPAAEFNFYADPDAAYIVLETFPESCTTRIFPWESALSSWLPWKWVIEEWFQQGTTKSQLMHDILANVRHNWQAECPGGYTPSDALALATVLDPTIVTDSVEVPAIVEIGGKLTKGQTVIDWNNQLKRPPLQILTEIDMIKFQQMMWDSTL